MTKFASFLVLNTVWSRDDPGFSHSGAMTLGGATIWDRIMEFDLDEPVSFVVLSRLLSFWQKNILKQSIYLATKRVKPIADFISYGGYIFECCQDFGGVNQEGKVLIPQGQFLEPLLLYQLVDLCHAGRSLVFYHQLPFDNT